MKLCPILSPLVCGIAVACASVAGAQTYPTQPIRVVVPFTPGGGTDVLSRQLTQKMAADAQWNFVIDNKPGAGGNIGLDVVAKSKNDGYTLGMGQTANLAINPTLYPKMQYDALKDFAPVVLVASQPAILAVREDSPFRTLADLVAAARKNAAKLTMASSGSGTVTHLAGEMFAKSAGVAFVHVPYKGAAPGLTDTLGGQTDFIFITPPGAMPMINAGRLPGLAVTSLKRLAALPDVPTIAESGYPGFEATDWKALVAPAGTPAAIVERLNTAANKALRDPDLVKRLRDEGSEARGGTPAELAQFIRAENTRWGASVRDSGAKVE